jgi:translocation and assembly module TamB
MAEHPQGEQADNPSGAKPDGGQPGTYEAPKKPPRRSVLRRGLSRPFALVLGLAAAILPWFLAAWLIATPQGFRATAAGLSALTRGQIALEGVSGKLNDRFSVERLHIDVVGIRIDASGVTLDWHPAALFGGMLHARTVIARTLEITYRSTPTPAHVPNSFALPIAIQLDDVHIARFDLLAQEVSQQSKRIFGLRDAAASGLLDHTDWRIDSIVAQTDWGHAELKGRLAPVAPFAIDANGRFRAQYGEKDLDLAVAASGSLVAMTVEAKGSAAGLDTEAKLALHSFDAQPIGGLELTAGVIDPHRFLVDAPRAALTVHAQLTPTLPGKGVPEAARRAALHVEGPIEVTNAEPGRVEMGRLPVQRVAGRLSLADGMLNLKQMEITLPGGGSIKGDVGWTMPKEGEADRLGLVEGTLQLVSLDPSVIHGSMPRARLAGQIRAEAQGKRQHVVAKLADAKMQLALEASHEGGRVEIQSVSADAGSMHAKGSGHIALGAPKSFAADVSADRFDPHFFWSGAPEGQISGDLKASGKLEPQPALDVSIDLRDSRLAGLPLVGKGSASIVGKRLAKVDLALEALGNKLTASGSLGAPSDRLDFRISATELDKIGHGFGGRLRARGSLGGSYTQPAGEVEVVADKLSMPTGARIDALNFRARLSEGIDGLIDARMAIAGVRMADSSEQMLHRASLVSTGTRGDHTIKFEADFARGRSVAFTARGGLSDKLDWTGMLTRLTIVWQEELELAAPATLAFGPDHLDIGSARLRGETADIQLQTTKWKPGNFVAIGHMSGLKLGLTLNEERQVVAHGETLTIGAEWNISSGSSVDGLVRVFRQSGDIVLEGEAPVALGLTELEAVLAANDSRLAFSFSAAGKTIGVISASATAEAEFTGSRWALARNRALLGRARIEVPGIDWLGPLIDQNLRTRGALQGDFSLSGTPADPVASGAINGDKLSLVMIEQGLRLEGGKLRVRFDRNSVFLDELSFESPSRVRPDEKRIDYASLTREPGHAGMSGQIDLATLVGSFKVTADRLPILQLPDRWIMMSGSAQIDTDGSQATIRGKVEVPAGYVGFAQAGTPRLDSDVVVRGRTVQREKAYKTRVDIEVDLGNSLYLKAFGVDTRLAGQLQLQARPGEPLRATGQIETREGRYDAYGQQLAIDQGLITFQGPVDNPTLSITAIRKGLQVEAGIQITGSAQRPKIKLVSNPNVPDAEKLSWIVLGRAPSSSSGGSQADAGLLVAAASVLMGDSSGGLRNDIARTFGIDQITITQGETRGLGAAVTSQVAGSATGFSPSSASASSDTVSGEVVQLAKRLSDTLNLSFEQSLTGTGSLVKLTYILTRRISVVAQGGTDNSIDLGYTISFR